MTVLARVELDEIGRRLGEVLHEDRDGKHRVRHFQHPLRTTRALLREDEAREVRACLCSDGDVLLARHTADLHQGTREQLAQLRGGIARAHQRRADESGIRAGELRRGGLRARVDARLRNDHAVAGRSRDELELRTAIDRKGRQFARIDPDHVRIELDGALELASVVCLDEHVEAELGRVSHQRPDAVVVEIPEQQQCGIRADDLQLQQLQLLREEALREQNSIG